jgi:hypothetical protein
LDGYFKEENQPLIVSTIHSIVGVVEVHNHLRTNEGLLADIWDGLWNKDTIRSLDMDSISIYVKDGEAYLTGHLANENNLLLIERIARSVVGIMAVHNYLVTDRELTIQVARALARDERTRPFILPVSASHGWIHLGGELPTHELQVAAEKVTTGVSGVRGVITLPRITGERSSMLQRAVQPRIGAVVYGENGEVGVVTEVVILPQDRLVTNVVICSNETRDGRLVTQKTIVPVTAIDLVNPESLFLMRSGPSLNAYPDFDPDYYPMAPITWKAPYPYTAGEVRWSLRETLDEGSQPESQSEIKPVTDSKRTPARITAQAAA